MRYAIFFVLIVVSHTVYSAPILLLSGDTQVRVRDPDAALVGNPLGLAADSTQFFAGPFSASLSTSIGNSSGSTSLAFTESTGSTMFSVEMGHAFDNSSGTTAAVDFASTSGFLQFTALEDATYSLSGIYEGVGSDGFALSLQLSLFDLLSPVCCFTDTTASQNLSGTHVIAPGVAGDGNDRDFFGGSLTGNLIAGHEYAFQFNFAIGNDTDGFGGPTVLPNNSSATAFGSFLLEFGSPIRVPEPPGLALFVLGLLGLGLAVRGRGP